MQAIAASSKDLISVNSIRDVLQLLAVVVAQDALELIDVCMETETGVCQNPGEEI